MDVANIGLGSNYENDRCFAKELMLIQKVMILIGNVS